MMASVDSYLEGSQVKVISIIRRLVLVTSLVSGGVALAQESLQLDETCTVTVGNQTAIVRPDGTFLVSNVSVFQSRTTGIAPQLYPVRATCIRHGQMITGQSDFFSLTPAAMIFIADVFPTELDPIPVRINVTGPADFLPLGQSVQLPVTATLPDGSTEDVMARSRGTTYLSTNPRLLTVTYDGLAAVRVSRGPQIEWLDSNGKPITEVNDHPSGTVGLKFFPGARTFGGHHCT